MAHQHGGTADLDWSAMLDALARADEIEADVTAQIAGWLLTGPERVIYDVGCGAGGMTAALSAAAPDARLVAVDGEPALLAATRRHTGVETVLADLGTELPIPPASADLIWASGVLHHLPDQQSVVTDLATRLAPGGRLALGEGGLQSRSLPWDLGIGEPGLEIRLDAAHDRWFTRMRRDLGGALPMAYGWSTALRHAGLVDVTARSFLIDLPAPLGPGESEYVIGRLRSLLERDGLEDLVSAEDRDILRRLTDPEDAVHRSVRSDLYLLAARTVYVGRRPDA
ncbi:MAG: class I SAM-dependent methyltransferase [Geodermatophilaceae bacterium]|nr:class I SAM-dependent methyltransferase [Geodermatophilaceae bacterium]